MTSQEVEVSMDELKAEAKELNITSWQVFKDPEKLKAKIEEVKASGGVQRKKAPKLKVSGLSGTSRNEIIRELEKNDPGCKYITQKASITSAEAEAKGMEIVKKENGDVMYCGEDVVCRTDEDSYKEWQSNRTKNALTAMKSIDKDLSTKHGGKKIQSLTEQPKTGRDPDDG